jgi:hypothetical protein
MSGGRYRPVAGASPLDVIAELEELLRRLLKGLATGELGGDLRAAADEVLLSDGLAATHLESPGIGETAEWRLPDPAPDDALDLSAIADGNLGDEEISVHKASEKDDGTDTNQMDDLSVRGDVEDRQPTTRIVVDDVELPEIMSAEGDHRAPTRPDEGARADWFSAGDGEPEWPAFAKPRRKDHVNREPSKDRVRYLFPVPDATDWSVGELRYERKRSG